MLANTLCKLTSTAQKTKTLPSSTMTISRQQCGKICTKVPRQLSKMVKHITTRLLCNYLRLHIKTLPDLPGTANTVPLFLIMGSPQQWVFQRTAQSYKNHQRERHTGARHAASATEHLTSIISSVGSLTPIPSPINIAIQRIVRGVSQTVMGYVSYAGGRNRWAIFKVISRGVLNAEQRTRTEGASIKVDWLQCPSALDAHYRCTYPPGVLHWSL